MGFLWEKIQTRQGDAAEITGYEGEARELTVPESIEGLPVVSIGNHALADREDLREIWLPASLKTLHLFAFQNDMALVRIHAFNTADDYYDGVIRSCDSLREIVITMKEKDSFVLMREMLQDTDNALSFVLVYPEETIRLTFPEYVREAREDTMARAIHFTIEGAGMAYRECIEKHALHLAEYDRLLPRLTSYDDTTAAEICLDRLMYPKELGEEAGKQYRDWLFSHTEKVLLYLIPLGDTARISFLERKGLLDPGALDAPLCLASKRQDAAVCGILMQAGAGREKKTPPAFSFDDF